MRSSLASLVVIVCLQSSGCATNPEVDAFVVPTIKSSFVIGPMPALKSGDKDVGGGLRASKRIGLLPGTYTAVKQNSYGIFYDGPNPALWEEVGNNWALSGHLFAHRGGVWISSDPALAPRLYTYPGTFSAIKEIDSAATDFQTLSDTEKTQAVNAQIVRQITLPGSPSMSPVAGGIAGGIAGGLVAALAESGSRTPFFVSQGVVDPVFLKELDVARKAGSTQGAPAQ